jgi:hypothetical protein
VDMGRLLLVVVGADSVASDYGGAQAPWRSNMAHSGTSRCKELDFFCPPGGPRGGGRLRLRNRTNVG